MKTLDIFGNNKEEDNFICFEEVMNTGGYWTNASISREKTKCLKLYYESDLYDYFIMQCESGIHYLYRNRKK